MDPFIKILPTASYLLAVLVSGLVSNPLKFEFSIFGVQSLGLDGCNDTISCWFHPPGCQTKSPANDCVSAVKWRPFRGNEGNGWTFEISSYINTLDPTRPYWMAVGLSHNQRMDDDTVLECISSNDGQKHLSQLSFNDETHNSVLYQASESLVIRNEISLVDGLFTCNLTYLPDNLFNVAEGDRFKVHNLEAKPYYLLFAKGSADRYTMQKDIHFMNDGPDFPWITNEMVKFCHNCSDESFALFEDSIQTHVERYWRYRIAVFHGSALMFSWWVLVSNGILIARFFKPMWPRRKLFGAAVWFQLHRSLVLIAFPLQILSVLLIFYQAGWVWYECSYECDLGDLSKKMHAVTGIVSTLLASANPLVALLRPAPDSRARPIFNWIHWLIGMSGWIFASLTILLSVPLGKTGLYYNYGPIPYYIMGGYILFFVGINILLEMITSTSDRRLAREGSSDGVHRFVVSPSGMSLSVLNGPSTESPTVKPMRGKARLVVLLFHCVVSVGVTITITVFLLKILWSHSP